jgi:sulfatase maturation enzyme AslB (radical SAM superfamily)
VNEKTVNKNPDTAPARPRHNRNMQIVVKVSKLCNLRCEYCYEYPELGNRAAMSREQLAAMYRSLGDYLGCR